MFELLKWLKVILWVIYLTDTSLCVGRKPSNSRKRLHLSAIMASTGALGFKPINCVNRISQSDLTQLGSMNNGLNNKLWAGLNYLCFHPSILPHHQNSSMGTYLKIFSSVVCFNFKTSAFRFTKRTGLFYSPYLQATGSPWSFPP